MGTLSRLGDEPRIEIVDEGVVARGRDLLLSGADRLLHEPSKSEEIGWRRRHVLTPTRAYLFASLLSGPISFGLAHLDLDIAVAGAFLMSPISLALNLVIGVPASLALRRMGATRWSAWLGAGAALGACVGLLSAIPFRVPIGLIAGATSAFFFRLAFVERERTRS